MYSTPCHICGDGTLSELVYIGQELAHYRCPVGHTGFQALAHFKPWAVEEAQQWLYCLKAYPQGSYVKVRVNDRWREVEVVGHSHEVSPSVRVYVRGYGTMLLSPGQLDDWNGK